MNSADEPLYSVTIEGEGLTLSRQIDAPTLGRVLYSLLSGTDASLVPSKPSMDNLQEGKSSQVQVVRLSLREYLNEVGANSYPEKIASIGYYLEAHEGAASFSKDDIKSRFRTAGEAAPANFHRDFSSAVSSGWIAEDVANGGRFYVTHTGQAAVAAGFAGGRPTPVRATRRRRGGVNRY